MNNMTIIKRIGAYIIDFMIILLINTALTNLAFINPTYDKYMDNVKETNKILEDFSDEKIDYEKYQAEMHDLSYELNKSGYVYIIGNITITLLYFGVFAYFTQGQTLGKKILNLKIVSAKDDKPLKIYNYLLRSFILNALIVDVFNLVGVFINRNIYFKLNTIASNINYLVVLAILLMVLFRKDGRGLHDIIAGSKVIDLKTKNEVIETKEDN